MGGIPTYKGRDGRHIYRVYLRVLHLRVYLRVWISQGGVYLSVYLRVYTSVYTTVYLRVCTSVCTTVYLRVCTVVCTSVYTTPGYVERGIHRYTPPG